MLSMRENKEKIYSIGILLSIVLIFLDAYEIFSIPISWIGMALLSLLALYEFKTMYSKNQKPLANFEDGRKSLVLAQKAMESTKSRKFEKIKLIFFK